MRIAILGAHGFLGRKLATLLNANDHEVVGFVLNPGLYQSREIQFRSVDEILSSSPKQDMCFDVVINLAARRSTRSKFYSDSEVNEFTFEIPKQFILRTVGPNTEIINASTYIQNFNGEPGRTVDSYGAAKEKLSKYLENESLKHGLKVKDLFFFTLYGPGDKHSHLVPLLLDAAKTGQEIALSPGDQLINLHYVDDAAQNIVNCMSIKEQFGYSKNYVWEESYVTIKQLVEIVEKTIQVNIKCLWGSKDYAGHEMFQPWPIPMSQLPNYVTTTGLEEGISKIWKSMQ